MENIFLGLLWDPLAYEGIKAKTRRPTVHPATRFQWSLINGIEEVTGCPLTIINCLPVGAYPKHYNTPFLPSQFWSHCPGCQDYEIGGCNIPLAKQIWRTIVLKRKLRRMIPPDNGSCTIFVYSLYQPFLSAIDNLPENVKVYCIVTDLPSYYDLKRTGFLRKIARLVNNKLIYRRLNRINGFVLLTDQMATILGITNRPRLVVEGIIDPTLHEMSKGVDKANALLYSGTLNFAYGICEFVEAFLAMQDRSCELWICGSGEGVDYIKNAAKRDGRIKYYGLLEWEDLRILQQRARFLVNPRKNEGEYTKFSFPSKTMEYLASGTPVIAYWLDGIPTEYKPYAYWLVPELPKDTAKQLDLLMSKTDSELRFFGERARLFVLGEKNQKRQAQKILDGLV